MVKHIARIAGFIILDAIFLYGLLTGKMFPGPWYTNAIIIAFALGLIRAQGYYVLDYLYEWVAIWRTTLKEVKELRKEVAELKKELTIKEDKENLP